METTEIKMEIEKNNKNKKKKKILKKTKPLKTLRKTIWIEI